MYVDTSLVAQVMLLCDGCDAPTHLACTQPRLRRVPKGDWFCAACSATAANAAAGCAFDCGLTTAACSNGTKRTAIMLGAWTVTDVRCQSR